MLFTGDPGIPKGYSYNALDLVEPRVGFAWDMTGGGKQTLRGSYSIFYDLPETYYADRFGNAAPWGAATTVNPGTNGCTATSAGVLVNGCEPGFTSPYGWAGTATTDPYPLPFPPSKNYIYPAAGAYVNFQLVAKIPQTQEWGLSFQRQFPHNWLFTASYLGSHTVHIWGSNEVNPAIANPPGFVGTPSTSNTNQRRVLYLANATNGAYYGTIAQQLPSANASYNGLLLNVTHRFSQNFSMLSNYTYSHCLSLADFQGRTDRAHFPESLEHQRGLRQLRHASAAQLQCLHRSQHAEIPEQVDQLGGGELAILSHRYRPQRALVLRDHRHRRFPFGRKPGPAERDRKPLSVRL